MSAPTNGTTTIRRKWRYSEKAKDFHAEMGWPPYAQVPVRILEDQMYDDSLASEHRTLAAIWRFAWGNLSKFVVDGMPQVDGSDPRPQPVNQDWIAERIGMPESTFSDACTLLKAKGYLDPKHPFLYPVLEKGQLALPLFASLKTPLQSPNFPRSEYALPDSASPFLRHKAKYLAEHPEFAEQLSDLITERDFHRKEAAVCADRIAVMDRRILASYRNEQRRQQRESESPSTEQPGGSESPAPEAAMPTHNTHCHKCLYAAVSAAARGLR